MKRPQLVIPKCAVGTRIDPCRGMSDALNGAIRQRVGLHAGVVLGQPFIAYRPRRGVGPLGRAPLILNLCPWCGARIAPRDAA